MAEWPPQYSVRRSKRARYVHLRVTKPSGLEIILPEYEGDEIIAQVLETKKRWILKHLAMLESRTAAAAGTGLAADGLPGLICLHGGASTALVDWRKAGQPSLGFSSLPPSAAVSSGFAGLIPIDVGEFTALCQNLAHTLNIKDFQLAAHTHCYILPLPDGTTRQKNDRLRLWVKNYASLYLGLRLKGLSVETGLQYEKMRIGFQKSRWGSCTAQGVISLNAKLIFMPENLSDNIILHELCHRKELNHSERFWSLMQHFRPDALEINKKVNHSAKYIPAWVG